jgi:hypothetical protein
MGETGYRVIREELPRDLFQAFRRDPALHCASLQEAIIYPERRNGGSPPGAKT